MERAVGSRARGMTVVALAVLVAAASAGCWYPDVPAVYDGGAGDGGDASAAVFNGCTEARFVDRSAEGADRRVGFGGELGSGVFAYAPACTTVAAGQSVTFVGAFDRHPLGHGTGPSGEEAGSPGNPIPEVASGTEVPVMFPAAGVYPYYCEMHYASGMVGVVRVR